MGVGSGHMKHLKMEEEMDAINTTLRKVSRLWSIPLSSLSITI
jgi:hypothetical protein